jgi:thiamine biosynthesis lipoprotein
VNLWRNARRKRALPAAEQIAEYRARVGWQKLTLDPMTKRARLAQPEMRLDCGAIAKGYAIDAALQTLRDRGWPHALVAGGGDMAAGEPPPGQAGWKIEVAALDGDGSLREVVLLANRAIATSGDAFQYLEIDGVRYSHIVDPRTGVGLTDHSLVTVLAPDCATADSLATAVSVLGPERGARLLEETPGTSGRIVRQPGAQVEVTRVRWP